MSDIKDLEGIGPKNEQKLNDYGIFTIDDLKEAGETEEGRKRISEETGIYLKWIENWVEQAKNFQKEPEPDIIKDEEDVEEESEFNQIEEKQEEKPIFNKMVGIQEEYIVLLEKAGFKDMKKLATQKPLDLLNKLHKTNQKYDLVKRMPSINQIIRWIEQAKKN